MIKAVLFDIGGTLHCSTLTHEREIWFADRLLERLADYGIKLDISSEEFSSVLKENAEYYKHATEESLLELPGPVIWNDYYLRGFDIGIEKLEPIAEELSFLYDYERPKIMRRPHLTETMDALKDMGIRLGIISNIVSTSVGPHFLAEYGLTDYMECCIYSSVVGIRKPDPEIFRIAEREMDLGPESFAYVGDTVSRDIRGVRNAGWHTMIQILSDATRRRDKGITGYTADYVIDDLLEIPDIVKKINTEETI